MPQPNKHGYSLLIDTCHQGHLPRTLSHVVLVDTNGVDPDLARSWRPSKLCQGIEQIASDSEALASYSDLLVVEMLAIDRWSPRVRQG